MIKKAQVVFLSIVALCSTAISAQGIRLKNDHFQAVGVEMSIDRASGKKAARVIKDSAIKEFDEPTFARLREIEFLNGTIEVKVKSRLLKNAPEFARGFIGVAFHINESNTRFECIYLRPTNGRAEDQVRRNHSIQYFAYPDYKFQRLRKEAPQLYESYADMELDEWIAMRIVVQKQEAKLYLNKNEQPSLVIKDLKLGDKARGSIGLWVDVGTEGFFRDLRIIQE